MPRTLPQDDAKNAFAHLCAALLFPIRRDLSPQKRLDDAVRDPEGLRGSPKEFLLLLEEILLWSEMDLRLLKEHEDNVRMAQLEIQLYEIWHPEASLSPKEKTALDTMKSALEIFSKRIRLESEQRKRT